MTIHARTQINSPLPAYVNLREHDIEPGIVILTVRSQGHNNASAMPLSRDDLQALVTDAQTYLDKSK